MAGRDFSQSLTMVQATAGGSNSSIYSVNHEKCAK